MTSKVVLLGQCNVGKSSIASFIVNSYFGTQIPTIGVDFHVKAYKSKNGEYEKEHKMHIYDCTGNKKFERVIFPYYSTAKAAVIVYDCTDFNSLIAAEQWIIEYYNSNRHENKLVYLIGNKCDMKFDEDLIDKKIEDIKTRYIIKNYKCSAKTGDNIHPIFEKLFKDLMTLDEIYNNIVITSEENQNKWNCSGCKLS